VLDGAPGVESAYYAGPNGDGAANLAKLVERLRDVPDPERGAHFRCVLVVTGPRGAEQVFEGLCGGHLLRTPRGGAGAELGEDVKNRISHRARAWAKLTEWIRRQ
jgi:XTP/dITP diphosphohydrolase